MSSQKDYSEIICTAVDEIITARLQGLEYDITKLCTVVDNSRKNEGRYVVSDGSTRFEAFSTENNYQNGNSVQVLIPNGDYTLQKTIVSRVAATDTTPFNYTSPISTMIKITNNIFDSKDAICTSGALLANENNQYTCTEPLYSIISHDNKFAGFSRLGITADFKSWLSSYNLVSGIYGLRILIYADGIDKPGHNTNQVYELTFNTEDMIGNPYQFDTYFTQEKVFDISHISNIKQIDISLYQNGAFTDGDGDLIPWQTLSVDGVSYERLPNNLFVDNINIYLGYEQDKYTEETLMLYTTDTYTYYPNDNGNAKNIGLRWIHKIDDSVFEMLDELDLNENNIDYDALDTKMKDEIFNLDSESADYLDSIKQIRAKYDYLKQKYHIHWFRYSPGYEHINEYAGKDWMEIKSYQDQFNFVFDPNAKKRSEEIKVICFINEGEIITPYYSNTLVFTNEANVPDDVTYDATVDLTINYTDNSKGNYFIYNQNGKIINEGQGQGFVRYLEPLYKGNNVLPDDFWVGDYITWYLPEDADNEGTSMLIHGYSNKKMLRETEYATYTIEPIGGKIDNAKVGYSIRNVLRSSAYNNTICCVMKYHGVEYEAVEELRFGKAGTNGTNTTFIIEFDGNENALIAESNSRVGVCARRYDADGRRVDFTTDDLNKIKWGWHIKSNNDYMTIEPKSANNRIDIVIIGENIIIPEDNYYILKASFEETKGKPILEAYLPIPIKASTYSHIEGAREVIYNHQGVPSYYSDAYELFDKDNGKIKDNISWYIKNDENVNENTAADSYLPSLGDIAAKPGKKGFVASQFYASGYDNKTCVYCKVNDEIVWSQPILIMQSNYDFAMLNEWGGGLTLDEENGTILSTMLGAGRKNSQNQFSGVLIGDIKTGTGNDDADSQTGVYGLHEGVISYALKEDGTATFGKAGHGQIHIDGNEGTIKSAEYDKIDDNENDIGTGLMMDLDDGILDIKNNGISKIKIQPDATEGSPYLKITGNGNIPLMEIGESDDNQYLQSYLYGQTQGRLGTQLNLADNVLNVKGTAGQIKLSGSEEEDLFKVQASNGANPLILMNNENYYLQSNGYTGQRIQTIGDYSLYDNELTNIPNGDKSKFEITKIVAYDGTDVYQTSESEDGTINIGDPIDFANTTITIVLGKEDDGKEVTSTVKYTSSQYKLYFIANLTPRFENTNPSGLKIDLNDGTITGYDLYLKGTKLKADGTPDGNKAFVLDSSAQTTPFIIGDKFKVGWDGKLTCESVHYLGNEKPGGGLVINMNNNFKVSSSGGVSGNSCSFGGGWMGGTSAYANKLNLVDKADSMPIAVVNDSGQLANSGTKMSEFQEQIDKAIATLEAKMQEWQKELNNKLSITTFNTFLDNNYNVLTRMFNTHYHYTDGVASGTQYH